MSGRPSRKSAEIGLFWPFFLPFSPFFRRAWRTPGKSRKRRKKAPFLRYPRISLNPHLLNPPFAALQERTPHSRLRQENPSPNSGLSARRFWRVQQDTFAEQVKVRQENMTARWGSARSALSPTSWRLPLWMKTIHSLSFHSLLFLFYQGKTSNLPRIFSHCRTHKILGKGQRKYQNNQGNSLLKINQGNPKNQGMEGQCY